MYNIFERLLDAFLCGAAALCFGYVFTQVEPFCSGLWLGGEALGARAGADAFTPSTTAASIAGGLSDFFPSALKSPPS